MPDVRMTTPRRIQRKRTKGWRMPEGAVYVGRPTKWGNPLDWRECSCDAGPPEWARGVAAEDFAKKLYAGNLGISLDDVRRELRGKDLSCWCKPDWPCHADVLLAAANA